MIPFQQTRLAPADAWRISGILLAVIVIAIAGISGGMPLLLMSLALGLSLRVYHHPDEAIIAGPMFLLAANVFLPSSARFDVISPHPRELIYWAAGSFMITMTTVLRLGLRPLWAIPHSLRTFVVVAIVASAYGIMRGNDVSYVLRQLYGSLLLVLYFAFALSAANEETFTRALKTYSIICVVGFLVYYIAVFQELGLHREITTLGTQTVMLGILFAAYRGLKWRMAAALMMIPPALLVVRRDLAAFALGAVIIAAMRAKSKAYTGLMWALAATIIVVSLVPTYVGFILDTATNTRVFDNMIPQGGRDSNSIEDRVMQLVGAGIVVSRSPLLGQGMGGELEFISAGFRGEIEGAYVDNGWAYLLTKMGFLGFLVFAWFAFNLLQWMPGNSVSLSAALLTILLLVMFAEPVFFQFSTSPFMGAMAGLLYARRLRVVG